MDITKPLKRDMNYVCYENEKPVTLFFSYERLREFCYHCGLIGHSISECLEVKTPLTSLKDLELNFGPYLRADSPFMPRKTPPQNSEAHEHQAETASDVPAHENSHVKTNSIELNIVPTNKNKISALNNLPILWTLYPRP